MFVANMNLSANYKGLNFVKFFTTFKWNQHILAQPAPYWSRITILVPLLDPQKTLKNFFQRMHPLKKQMGVILFLIPKYVPKNYERLEAFLKLLPAGYRCAFEFRDCSWFDESIYELLRKY